MSETTTIPAFASFYIPAFVYNDGGREAAGYKGKIETRSNTVPISPRRYLHPSEMVQGLHGRTRVCLDPYNADRQRV